MRQSLFSIQALKACCLTFLRSLALLCLLSTVVLGQEGPGDSQGLGPKHFDRLTNLDGLSQISVVAITQDQQGFLWFGTGEGLNRYDGYSFEVFHHDPEDPNSLPHRRVQALYGADADGVWVGTDGGLSFLDAKTGRFMNARHDPADPASLSDDRVFSITRDRSGTLWVGTRRGLDRLESAAQPWRFTHWHDGEDHRAVRAILEDSTGALWIGTEEGLDRLAPDRQEIQRFRHIPGESGSLASDRVRALLEDSAGTLWIGTEGGLDRFDREGGFFEHYLPMSGTTAVSAAQEIRGLGEGPDGRLWVGTTGGLFCFDPGERSFEPVTFETDASKAKKTISSLVVDDVGALWFGTWISGIYRHDPSRAYFDHFRHDPDDPSSLFFDAVYAFAEDAEGTLWVGTAGGGVNRFDATSGSFSHLRHDPDNPQSLASDSLRCLLADSRGALWIGSRDRGLDRFEVDEGRFVHHRHDPTNARSLSHDQVLSLAETRNGEVWVGTRSGLDRYDPEDGGFERHVLSAGTSWEGAELLVMAILEGRGGELWVGTREGLFRYRDQHSRRFLHHAEDPRSLSYNHILSLHQDSKGDLWVGTAGGGINRLDLVDETFERFTAEDGLGNNMVHAILEDDTERLWISTNRGLVRFDPMSGRWTRYDRADGLQDMEFNVGAALLGRDGTMYFGGVQGFNAFHPKRFVDNPHVPPVLVTAFEVLRRDPLWVQPTSHGQGIELGFRENFFSFEFTALNYTRPDKNRYAYRLEGLDADWVEAGQRRFASYTNVPPGEYTFRVRGSNNDGVWNEQGASFPLVIRPPWWRTWWAYGFSGLLLASTLGGFLFSARRKVRRERAIAAREREIRADLEAKNSELERFVYTVSHDLKNPLVTIRNYAGMVRHHLAADGEERLLGPLDRIDRASAHMQQMLEDLVELSRIGRVIHELEHVALGELAKEAAEMLAKHFADAGTELMIKPDLPRVQVDRQRVREVLQNLFENGLKFHREGSSPRLELGLESREGGFGVFFVRDNGIGIEKSYHEKIFQLFERLDPEVPGTGIGLALVQRIVSAHGGRIWVESEGLGTGSTFCFTLPLSEGEEPESSS